MAAVLELTDGVGVDAALECVGTGQSMATALGIEVPREEIAETCVVKLAVKLPALVDEIDNRTERAYTGWPDRLYVVGTDGRIKFKSAPGPYGFKTSELEQHLKALLRASS